ncbi:MAG: hypothetical protein ACXWLB_08400 [Reyranella sp.]
MSIVTLLGNDHSAGSQRRRTAECILVPLTRSHSAAALQFELELAHLDQLDQFRERGVGTSEETGNWMRGFSEILVSPPLVEILRVEEETQQAV